MIGSTLSHYEITAELGRGGMGIVYRATDTKLNREVALKILPAAALASKDDRARFFREAQAAAQLHHANIATVFEIDEAVPEGGDSAEPRPFIAMEFIEGQTLEDRIKEGPLKLKEAIHIASEVADALKAAHDKEIVHRDIKSANVMLSADGKAKVLDFGLAKTTHSTMLTRMGSTMGTVAFMSPEQARGQEVDGRSDIYSLGTVLYEMISGRLPFGGEYEQAVVYGILNESPEPLTALRTGVPMNLEWIVNKCLAKSAEDRYQSASGLMVDLRNVDLSDSGASRISTASMAAAPVLKETAPEKKTNPILMSIVAAATLILGLAAGYFMFSAPTPELKSLQQVSIDIPKIRNVSFPVLSNGNKFLAFFGTNQDGFTGLFLMDMSTGQINSIEGTAVGITTEIKFSPSGNRLAYTVGGNGGIFTVTVPTGLPEQQTDHGRIAYWEDESSFIVVDDTPGGKTYRKTIGQDGKTELNLIDGELSAGYVDIWKTNLPGNEIAFGHSLSRAGAVQTETSTLIRAMMKDGATVEHVESPIMNPEYVSGGFLMYQQRNDSGTLVVRPIDDKTGDWTGTPVRAVEDYSPAWSQYSVTDTGDLLIVPSSLGLSSAFRQALKIVDLTSEQTTEIDPVIPDGALLKDLQVSDDGAQLLFRVESPDFSYIAVYDFTAKTTTKLTFEERTFAPVWSHDGSQFYYTRSNEARVDLRVMKQDTSPEAIPEEVISDAIAWDVSNDGSFLVFSKVDYSNLTPSTLHRLNLDSGEVTDLDVTPGVKRVASISSDGEYVAYMNINESGVRELWVVASDGTRPNQVLNVEGNYPRFSAQGDYLYFSSSTARRIPIRTSPSFNFVGEAETLYNNSWFPSGFDIFPDQSRIIQISSDVMFQGSADVDSKVIWYQNWSDHLKKEFGK